MTGKEKETVSNNILLLLASLFFYGKPIEGRTRLQKIIFLLKNRYEIPFNFNFKPYYYGPYSEELSDLVSLLRAFNFAEEKIEYFGFGKVRYSYALTEKGEKYFAEFGRSSGKDTIELIGKLKKYVLQLNSLPTTELISEAKSLMNKKSEPS